MKKWNNGKRGTIIGYLCYFLLSIIIFNLINNIYLSIILVAILAFIITFIIQGGLLDVKVFFKIRKYKFMKDSQQIYKFIQDELVPLTRKSLPTKVYKFYYLSNIKNDDDKRLDSLENNFIWTSLYSKFNDPYEGKYFYINRDKIFDANNPQDTVDSAIELWDKFLEKLYEVITATCFSNTPDSMPMWAHYSNNHQGYCVEYEVQSTESMFPINYIKERMETKMLFIDMLYDITKMHEDGENRLDTIKHIAYLSTFKHKSWEYENEIRIIKFSHAKEILNKGKLFNCNDLGLKPTKIFIGEFCSVDNTARLQQIAIKLAVPYELCKLQNTNKFKMTN